MEFAFGNHSCEMRSKGISIKLKQTSFKVPKQSKFIRYTKKNQGFGEEENKPGC